LTAAILAYEKKLKAGISSGDGAHESLSSAIKEAMDEVDERKAYVTIPLLPNVLAIQHVIQEEWIYDWQQRSLRKSLALREAKEYMPSLQSPFG
jgi:hypothetical protein